MAVRPKIAHTSPAMPVWQPAQARKSATSLPSPFEWAAYVRYLRRCTARDAAGELPLLSAGSWTVLPLGRDDVVCGRGDALVLTKEIRDIGSALGPGRVLLYGWPLVVVSDRQGRRRVGALFCTELAPFTPASTEARPAEAEPVLSAALLDDSFFDRSALAEVQEYANRLPFGDAQAFGTLATRIAHTLGLDGSPIDPDQLALPPPSWHPGLHNCAGLFVAENSTAVRSLVAELGELELRTDWDQTAAAALLGLPGRLPDAVPATALAGPVRLTDSQEVAVQLGRHQPLVVVTGPPGTGKSQFVAGAVANAWLDGETVLVASTNNAAVNVATERCLEIHPALLVRTGNRELREKLPDRAAWLSGLEPVPGASQEVGRYALARAARARTDFYARIQERSGLEAQLAEIGATACDAARALWGEGVPQRADVAKLVRLRGRAQRVLKAWFFRGWRTGKLLRELGAPAGGDLGTFVTWARAVEQKNELCPRLEALPAPARDKATVAAMDSAWQDASLSAVLACVRDRMKSGSAGLRQLATARVGPTLKTAIHNARRATPAWSCTALSLQNNFELRAADWDLVIVDEASQCTIAQLLPLAYRAKRLAIVGDPNQLQPITRTPIVQFDDFAAEEELDPEELRRKRLCHGTSSAYLVAAAAVGDANVVLLDDHFRCHPAIARWFNQHFYGGGLTVLTGRLRSTVPQRGLHWVAVDGNSTRASGGSHVNQAEAKAVVDWLVSHRTHGATYGVVTPFAAQAGLIGDLMRKRLDNEAMQAIEFVSATAHRLQGAERDVILFSAVVGPQTPPSTASWVEAERNLINVAVSRARCAFIAFGNPAVFGQQHLPTLQALHAAATEPPLDEGTPWRIHSGAERIVYDKLVAAGIPCTPKLMVEGYELDFALRPTADIRCDVEIDGSQHLDVRGKQRRRDLARDQILREQGWVVVRVPAWRCSWEPDGVVDDIRAAMTQAVAQAAVLAAANRPPGVGNEPA